MPRPEKVQAVEDIKERIEAARATFLTEYRGLSVGEQQQLRRGLRAAQADYKVFKMSLTRRAMDELGIEGLEEWLSGPTALAFAQEDAVGTAKALRDFGREHERLVIKAGLLGREILAPEQVTRLADIEPREVLLGKLAGAMKAPLAGLAGMLASFTRDTASVLLQLLDRKRGESEPADAESAVAAAEAAETEEAAPPEVDDHREEATSDAGESADTEDDETAATPEGDEAAEEE